MHSENQDFLKQIDQHKGLIRSLCASFYAYPEDQKDAFQDIVLHLWKSRNTFRGGSKASTWIYRVGLNALLSKRRREQRSISAEPIDQHVFPAPTTHSDDDLILLQQVIQSLPDVDRALVILYLEGYQNREIAQIISLSPTNVGTRLNRIKAFLKQKFKTHSYESRKL